MAKPIYKSCDQVLFFKNAKDRAGAPIADTATVTYIITSRHPVDGVLQELDSGTLSWVSEGRFETVLDATVTENVIIGMFYDAVMVLEDLDGNSVEKTLELYGEVYK